MKKLFLILLVAFLLASTTTGARRKYIVPRERIPVPKTKYIKPYYKPKTGQLVKPHFKAPKGTLKPWYRPDIK